MAESRGKYSLPAPRDLSPEKVPTASEKEIGLVTIRTVSDEDLACSPCSCYVGKYLSLRWRTVSAERVHRGFAAYYQATTQLLSVGLLRASFRAAQGRLTPSLSRGKAYAVPPVFFYAAYLLLGL